MAVCRGCHPIEAEHWEDTIHAATFTRNPRTALERRTCEACHGPGAEHVVDPADPGRIFGYTRGAGRAPEAQNSACMQCHAGGPRLHWIGSMHERESLSCSDCHNPMSRISSSGLLREQDVNQTCFTCHPSQRVAFSKRSHMPLLEGKMDCVSCHQPHGSATDPLLQAGSTFELCTNCHADKRGPFLWEHAPATEGCTSCHLPHGSNRNNLLISSPPFLCQQCHAQIGLANHPITLLTPDNLGSGSVRVARDPRIIGRGCVTCHSQIHGSNHPSGARFHR
jgi:DmsE family decaheme c-type cytochrome